MDWKRTVPSAGTLGCAAAALLALAALPRPARAADNKTDTSLDVQNYRPSPGPGNYFGVEGSDVTPHLQVGFALDVNYQHKPLVFSFDDGTGTRTGTAVKYQVTLDFLWSLGIFNILELGIALPVVVAQDGEGIGMIQEGESLSTTAIRDLRLQLKGRILGKGKGGAATKGFGLAIALGLSVPTGDDDNFAGDANVTADAPVIIFDWRSDLVRVALNVGFRWRETSAVGADFKLGHQLLYGVGLEVTPLQQRLLVVGEFEGMFGFEKLDDSLKRTPMEARLGIGAAVDKNKDLSIILGGGMGFGNAVGAPLFRLIATVRYCPQNKDKDGDGILDRNDKCPDEKEDFDDFEDTDGCTDADNDGDGIDDLVDECPDEAEDADDFEDADGCPDGDNDGDGVADADDDCPGQAEDKDGFEDEDGCPDPDNDNDGIPDAADQCPDKAETLNGVADDDGCPEEDADADGVPDASDACPSAAEDKDGFEDGDGCPDLDNDGDGVPDAADQCPDKAETLNGAADGDGCPDEGAALVFYKAGVATIAEKIAFKKDAFDAKGKGPAALDVIVALMQANPSLAFTVSVTWQPGKGDQKAGEALALQRAQGIVQYLAVKGVDAGRLAAAAVEGKGKPSVVFTPAKPPAP